LYYDVTAIILLTNEGGIYPDASLIITIDAVQRIIDQRLFAVQPGVLTSRSVCND